MESMQQLIVSTTKVYQKFGALQLQTLPLTKLNKIMRPKTFKQLECQYKRVLKKAFPKLKFHGIKWNWSDVYQCDPRENPKFIRIYNAFRNTAKKRGHPFYT